MNNSKQKIETDKINQIAEKLAEQLQKGYSEDFKNYLKVASQFHRYSYNNQMLIFSQMPKATRVAGLRTWNKLGRRVKKGEKSIKIFGRPSVKRVVQKEDGSEEEIRFGACPILSVFDISQTEGEDIPNSMQSLGDEGRELYLLLKEKMQASGIEVTEKALFQGVQGVSYGGKVEILDSLDWTNKFLVLIHEFAHEIMHKGSENRLLPRGIKECQAEATAYIVAASFGIESNISSDYLINWGNTSETLKSNLTEVVKASQIIINCLSSADSQVPDNQPSEEATA